MGDAYILLGQCFINPFFLVAFLKLVAKEDNEMTYLGAFFTHLIGLVAMVAAFLGLRNLGLPARAILSTLAFFLVTLVMVKFLAKIGTGRAMGASVCFWIYNLALNGALWFFIFQPAVEAEGE